jgi:PAS domain S-box-containing protein
MKNNPAASETAVLLRQKAEEAFQAKKTPQNRILTQAETLKLLHELEVHQIELEMQNAELIRAQEQAELLSEKFTELYDFAPTAYFSLSKDGIIVGVNHRGAELFGKERSLLLNTPFDVFFFNEGKPVFHRFLEKAFMSRTKESAEFIFASREKSVRYAEIAAIASENVDECFLSVVNISEHKRIEGNLKAQNAQLKMVNDACIDREMRLLEVKREVDTLLQVLGRESKYKV